MDLNDLDVLKSIDPTLFDSLPLHSYVKDRSGKFLAMNQRNIIAAGFNTFAEIEGYDDFGLIECQDAKQIRNNDLKILKTGKPNIFVEFVNVIKKGPLLTTSYKIPLRSSINKKVIGIVGFSISGQPKNLSLTNKELFNYYAKNYYTQQEIDCLFYFLIKNKSPKQTALLTSLSPIIVKNIIDSEFSRFKCKNKTTLLLKIIENILVSK